MNTLKTSVLLVVILLALNKISATEFKSSYMGSMCQQEVEKCSDHAVCISTLAACHLKCPQPYDHDCFSFCGAPFNSEEYEALISCAQKKGYSDVLKQFFSKGVLLFNHIKS